MRIGEPFRISRSGGVPRPKTPSGPVYLCRKYHAITVIRGDGDFLVRSLTGYDLFNRFPAAIQKELQEESHFKDCE